MHFGKIVKKNSNQLSFEPKRVIGIAEIQNDYTFIKSYIFCLDNCPFQKIDKPGFNYFTVSGSTSRRRWGWWCWFWIHSYLLGGG